MTRKGVDTAAGFKRDQVATLAGLQERAVDIRTVSDAVGLAKPFQACITKRNVGDQFAGQSIAHFLSPRAMGFGQHGILKGQPFRAREKYLGPAECRRRPPGIRAIARKPEQESPGWRASRQ